LLRLRDPAARLIFSPQRISHERTAVW